MISSPKPAKGAVPRKRVKYPFSRKPLNNLANLPSSSISFRDILKQLEERLSLSSKDLMRRANDAFEIGSFARAIHKVEARATRIIEISFSLSLSPFSIPGHPGSWKHLIKILPHYEEESVTDEGIVPSPPLELRFISAR